MKNILWYDQPAKDWMTEALPIGNGRLGAMLFGGVPLERIQFNEDSLWIGDESETGAYQAFGDVFVDFKHSAATKYRRELDIDRAIHTVTYESGGVNYRREAFASHPAGILVFNFMADKPGALTGTVALTDMHNGKITAAKNRLISTGSLRGYAYKGGSAKPDAPPYSIALNYKAQVLVLHEGGTVKAVGKKIVFKNADRVTLLLDAGTDFVQDGTRGWRGKSPQGAITKRISVAAKMTYEKLLSEHVRDYQSLFERVSLEIGQSPAAALPTDERLENLGKMQKPDPGLESLLFNYGRYLLIASSRPGGLPANLQGKWNSSNNPPWRCDYHTDINVQMNYWPADVANLSECFEPYAAWLNSIREVRKAATKEAFRTRGWTMRGENGIFGGSSWQWVESGSAWCMQNIWEHYAFTGDKEYLRTLAYPMMKKVCEFWIDRLKELPDGTLVAPDGYSPEHGPREDGVSHDQQLIWDLFNNTAEAADALGVDCEFRNAIATKRDKLLGPKIGRWGQLQEWMVDRDDPKDTHRHVSHMVAIYPGRQLTPQTTPKLAKAAQVSLNARGDVSTGWSTAWKVCLWARLHDGNRAYKLIGNLLRFVGATEMNYQDGGGVYANLLCAHPPFQIDGNFGYVAGVCEMLLQSHEKNKEVISSQSSVISKEKKELVLNSQQASPSPLLATFIIHLLPALPRQWASGSVTGLRARGGFTVDIEWKGGKVTKYRIASAEPRAVKIRVNGAAKTVCSERI